MKKKKEVLRKCSACGIEFDILTEDYLKDKGKYFHTDCYKNKQMTRRTNPLSEELVNEKIKIIKENMKIEQQEKVRKEIELLNIKKKNLNNKITDTQNRDKFIKYIQSEYNITVLNKLFYIKLGQINNGTYKGLKEAISYEDLLYMFQTKRDFLNKTADKKERLGQGFRDINSRISYDLAIIINKYDSFKEWKEKQKLLEAEKNKTIGETKNKIDFAYINSVNNNGNNEENSNEININELIDEI